MRNVLKNSLLGAGLALLMAIGWHVALTLPASAETGPGSIDREEILAVYDAFKEAQNARDMDAIGSFFIDGPEFLWVSDGRSVWGREAVLARMGRFQKAEVWRVHPDLDNAEVIELGAGSAILHMPLVLEIGQAASPNRLGFLVSIVFKKECDGDWRIAALLTTNAKTPR